MNRKQLVIAKLALSCYILISYLSFAGTRIKTVEWSFGSYYSSTDIASGGSWQPASLTLYIPENGVVIRSAWLEFECIAVSATNISGLDIMFDAGTAASTVRDAITGQYTAQTGESIKIYAKADITSYLSSDFVGATSKVYTAKVVVTGPTTNAHSLKLYITYEYDDTSPRQIKTVRFPLFSDVNVASNPNEIAAGTYNYTYNAQIADSNVVIRQQWFEIRGFRHSGGAAATTDSSICLTIVGASSGSQVMNLPGDLIDSYDFRFLDHQGNGTTAGFAINTSQTVAITRVQNNTNYLGGECVVTYEYDNSSPYKTKTVRYFLGQFIGGNGGNISQNVYLEESGIEIINIYAQIYGSFDSTTAATLRVDSSINGYSVTQRGYVVRVTAAQISGYSIFHDLGEQKSNFVNGCPIAIGLNALAAGGGHGAELIITYKYSDESKAYTNYYQVMTGQSANGISASSSQTFSLYFPDWYAPNNLGTKTLRSAWFRADIINNSNTQDYTTTQSINSTSPQTVTHRTTTEAASDSVLYGNAGQITIDSTSATANYSISTSYGAFSGVAHICYSYEKPPNKPTNLTQYKANGTTVLTTGAWNNETTIVLKLTMTSPHSSDTLIPEIEVQPLGTSFTNTPNYTGSAVSYNGSPVLATVTITNLVAGTAFHWQARVRGNKGVSPWQSYPDPSPNGETEQDFGIDTSSPTIANFMSGGDTIWRNSPGTTYNVDFYDTLASAESKLSYIQYAVYSQTGMTGTTLKAWTNIQSTVNSPQYTNDWSVDFSSLVQGTNWVSVRAYDNAGNSTTLIDAFYILKDTTTPTVANFMAGGDTIWRNSPGTTYNVDFYDTLASCESRLSYIQYAVYSNTGMSGTQIIPWTNIASSLNSQLYTLDWSVDFSSLVQGTNWVSVRAYDNANNVVTLTDAFYILKDTNAPTVANFMSGGDTIWRNSPGTTYNVDFSDNTSLLNTIQYAIYSNTGMTGTTLKAWTDIQSTVNSPQYTNDWSVDFNSLIQGTNWVSVRAYDNAGLSSTLIDAFYILKDTLAPVAITDLVASAGVARGQVKLTWTAPGDDGSTGAASSYIVKYSTSPITTDAEFNAATEFTNSWVPLPAGSQEIHYVTGLNPGTTYYFAIKTKDKANNISSISNSASALPQSGNVHINEVYVLDSSGKDWIELYNDTGANVSLNGWKIIYNTGSISNPGTDITIWTGTSENISSSSVLVITLSQDLASTLSCHVKLFDNIPSQVDIVQWPVFPAGATNISWARISDGNKFFEKDPTPTKNLPNSISGVIKINEVSYHSVDTDQFIELFNTDTTTLVINNWTIRNKNGVRDTSPYRYMFQFTRKIYPNSFTMIYPTSIDNSPNQFTYKDCFGTNGLDNTSDFIALENTLGQVVDRITWQYGTNYVYYNNYASLISYENPATGGLSPINSLGRTTDGNDTDVDSSDFTSFAEPSDGIRNPQGTLALSNTVTAPASPIPRRFKIELKLGEDCSGGTTDTITFIRTGGSYDPYSPHIYRLADLGFNLSSTSTQSVIVEGVSLTDIDGHTLVDGAVYKVVLSTDTSSGRAKQVIKTNVTYDASVHNITANNTAKPKVGNGKRVDILKIDVMNNSAAGLNNIQLITLKVQFTSGTGETLTTSQAQALFGNVYIFCDNPDAGIVDLYQSAIDTLAIATISNNSISLDANGVLTIPISDTTNATINSNSIKKYFLVVDLASDASSQTPNSFKATIKPDTDCIIRDSVYYVIQTPNASSLVTSSATTAISLVPTIEINLGGVQEAMYASIAPNWDTGLGFYVGTDNSKLYAFNNDGTQKWSTPFSVVGAIHAIPEVHVEGTDTFIYVATDAGYLYKIKDTGTSGTTTGGWSVYLGAVVRSSPAVYNGYLYVGCNDQKLRKINKDTGAIIWDTAANISGELTGTVAVDEWTAGVNSCWIGSEGGTIYRINTADGQVISSLTTSSAIKTSPFIDAGYTTASNNLFIASTDGKVYCRNSLNLTTIPSGWTGRPGQEDGSYNVGSPIESSPYMSIEGNEKYLYFGADDGKLYKLNATTGTLVWTFQTGGAIKSSPIVYNGYVYFGSDDGNCYCISTSDGSLRAGWPVLTGAPVRSMPVLSDWDNGWSKVTFTSTDGKIYKFSIK